MVALAAAALLGCAHSGNRPAPIFVYASQTGQITLDQGDGGGNPFASALVELAGRDALTSGEFLNGLVALTVRKSRDFQHPDVTGPGLKDTWQFLPKPATERRVALVLVFSEYSASGELSSLPGAQCDAFRVSANLERAGFVTQTVVDPDVSRLEIVLRNFAKTSSGADIALLYTTGHGADVDNEVYLFPCDFPISEGKPALRKHAIPVSRLGAAMHATHANLLLYGGCRDNPFCVQGP
jgi:hypothetical protein